MNRSSALAALIAVPTLLVSACSQGGAASSGSGIEPAAEARSGIRAEVTTLVELARSLDGYELRLISQCMSDQGLTYVVPPAVSPPAIEKGYGFSVMEVAGGYPPLTTLPPDPNARFSQMGTQADRDTWNQALFGTEADRQTQTLSDGSGELSAPGEGCIAHAREVMFGSSSQGLEIVSLATGLPSTAVRAAALDPEMVTLNKEWSECMADKGHNDLGVPEEAISQARGAGEGQATSVRLAQADVACEAAGDYVAQRTALEDRYLTGLMDSKEAQITGAQETFTAAITKAKRELSAG